MEGQVSSEGFFSQAASNRKRSALGSASRSFLAALVFVLCLQEASPSFVINYLKNYDTLNYAWINCSSAFFETQVIKTSFSDVYVNLCRYLPVALYRSYDIPPEVNVLQSNIFIRAAVNKKYQYYFLNLSSNNGQQYSDNAEKLVYYWKFPDSEVEFKLEVNGVSYNEKVALDFGENRPRSPAPGMPRDYQGGNIEYLWPKSKKMAKPEGIYDSDLISRTIRGLLLAIMTIPLIVPGHLVEFGQVNLHVVSQLYLSSHFVTDVILGFFGEKVPLANLIALILLPFLISLGHLIPAARTKLDLNKTAWLVLSIAGCLNFTIYVLFLLRTGFLAGKIIRVVFLLALLSFGQRYLFRCLGNKDIYASLKLPLFGSLFMVLRLLQIDESPKGMVTRLFRSPLLGAYADETVNRSLWFFLGTVAQLVFVALVKKFPPNLGLMTTYLEDIEDNTIIIKQDNKL